MTTLKTLVSWSSGKDSAWLVHVLRSMPDIEIGALLTTINEPAARVAMHAVRTELLEAQATALELPLWKVLIPSPCSNEEYERAMGAAVVRAVAEGFTQCAFGDLFLEDVRRYREDHLTRTGLTPIFPLFGADTTKLAREMIAAGLGARLTCVNPKILDRSFAGREFDATLLADLPASVDPCGERGEFHSFAYRGPMLADPSQSKAASSSNATDSVRGPDAEHVVTWMTTYPERIVCLTEETTETLYLLGQGHRVVGVSGYTVRPPEAREKPKVSAFINARFDKIESLNPDLVLAFSDLQAELGAELVRRGIAVVTFNQRTVAEILQMIRMVGGLVGCQTEAETLADRLEAGLDHIRRSAARFPARLRAFFEEWDDPLISGIRWVEELVEIAGGTPIFPELAGASLAKNRIVDPAEVARRDPEIVFASWCGKKVQPGKIRARPGWDAVAAVRDDRIFEIKSTYILQPGPASLTDGVQQVHAALARALGVDLEGAAR